MLHSYIIWILFLFFLVPVAGKDGWVCKEDGYWYENGKKTEYDNCAADNKDGKGDKNGGDDEKMSGGNGWTCTDGFWTDGDGKKTAHSCTEDDTMKTLKGAGCTVTEQKNDAMNSLDRICINHTSYADGRCWWTYVPNGVARSTDGRKVPLVVDMHGGGGCAFHQYQSSGFKALADIEAGKAGGGMIVAYPQGGPGGSWVSHGTASEQAKQREAGASGKELKEWDDIDFLEQLILNMVSNSSYRDMIDPERVYMSGFSWGCMMAHRFSMERSNLVAGVGCHGGALTFFPRNQEEMDLDKAAYNIQPMPTYITIGENDGWFSRADGSWKAWKYFNGCTSDATNTIDDFVEHVASSCSPYTPELHTVMLVIKDHGHAPNTRATEKAWLFISQYKRVRERAALDTPTSGAASAAAAGQVCLLINAALFAMLAFVIMA